MIVSSIPDYPDNKLGEKRLWYYNYHGIPLNPVNCGFFKRRDYDELKSILVDTLKFKPLNSLYAYVSNPNFLRLNVNEDILTSLAYWISEFETRLPVYKFNVENYKDKNLNKDEVSQINREELLSRILEEDKKIKKLDPYESKRKLAELFESKKHRIDYHEL